MNRIIPIIGIFLAGSLVYNPVYSQTVFSLLKSLQKQADQNFEHELYLQAIPIYQELIQKKQDTQHNGVRLAQCYFKTRQYAKAVEQFEASSNEGHELTNDDLYRYAEALSALRQYDMAVDYYNQLLKRDPGNELLLKKIWRLKNIRYLYEDSAHFSVRALNFATPASEICPALFQNQLVFVTNAKTSGIVKNINLKTNSPFYGLYAVELLTDTLQLEDASLFHAPRPFARGLRSRYNIGPVAFYQNDQAMVYVATSEEPNDNDNRTLGLYFAKLENNQWVKTDTYPFNSTAYSITDITINESGTQLYFSSDMAGGMGKSDIYVSTFTNGNWTQPKNLGEPVNTRENEVFPYLHRSGALYFSSDGHPGFGGIDIFKISTFPATNEEPQNLGYPINSSFDDFGICLDTTDEHGYFTSNRNNGDSDDDIYEFDLDLQTYPYGISGVLRVKEHAWSDPATIQLWPGKQVALVDSKKNKVIVETTTDAAGIFSLTIPYFSKYFIQIMDESGIVYKVSLDLQKHKAEATEHEIVIVKDIYKINEE